MTSGEVIAPEPGPSGRDDSGPLLTNDEQMSRQLLGAAFFLGGY